MLEVVSRRELRLAIREKGGWTLVHRSRRNGLDALVILAKELASRRIHLIDISRFGVVMGEDSFSATRTMMCVSQTLALVAGIKIGSLSADFFELTSGQKDSTIAMCRWGTRIRGTYSGNANITTPKNK